MGPPGGTIRVQLEGDRLRVADQGPGIPDDDLPHVFDRFSAGDACRNTPGTGLGLSIVAQTITQHGGWVRAGRSAQGGAEFTVRLPGATTLEALPTPGEPAAAAAPSYRAQLRLVCCINCAQCRRRRDSRRTTRAGRRRLGRQL